MMLIRMKLLVLLVLSRYRVACNIEQYPKYQYIIWCTTASSVFLVLHYHIFKIKLQLIGLTSYISTCCDKSDGLSHDELRAVSSDSSLTKNIIKEIIKVEEKKDGSRKNSDAFLS